MTVTNKVSDEELKAHYCLEKVDIVPGDPETSAFKRRARLQQALWRERMKVDIGTQPSRPKKGQDARPLGSRIPFDYALSQQPNFLNDDIRNAVCYRIQHSEPYQTLKEDRLYCDLLSSMPMCFNLFGSLWGDLDEANRAVHRWWSDVPGKVVAVRFEWSPGRRLPGEYLENRSAFDAAFELDLGDGTYGVVGVETKYHEHCKLEKYPSDDRLERYRNVANKSGAFEPEAYKIILGTDLQQVWLDHLLALSMLQHPSHKWSWAKFVMVYPANNPSSRRAAEKYSKTLRDSSTFGVSTIESLLDADVLPPETGTKFKERYLW